MEAVIHPENRISLEELREINPEEEVLSDAQQEAASDRQKSRICALIPQNAPEHRRRVRHPNELVQKTLTRASIAPRRDIPTDFPVRSVLSMVFPDRQRKSISYRWRSRRMGTPFHEARLRGRKHGEGKKRLA